ncbi:SOS-response transcriptional repressor LexA [Paenibacillus mucilaginosus]
MLSDIERKILRIIANYWSGRHRCPSIEELMIKTGRSKEGIYKVLEVLAKEEYIEWSPTIPQVMLVIDPYERDAPTNRMGPVRTQTRYFKD